MRPGPVVAVTGASGFLGGALVERLRGSGRVRALYRRKEGAERAAGQGAGVEPVIGHLLDPDRLAELCRDADVVFHCAALMSKGDPELSRRTNVDGTGLVARVAAEAGVRRLLYVSSISVFGATPSRGGVITEADEPTGLDRLNPYARSKYEGELELRRLAEETGLEFTIVRPTNVWGPGSGPWFRTFERSLARLPVAFGAVEVDLVHVDDVVAALVAAAGAAGAAGGVFHVGHEMAEIRCLMAGIARVRGRRCWTLPPVVDRPCRMAAERLYRLLTGTRMSLSLTTPVRYPHDRAAQVFGYAPRVDLETGMDRLRAPLDENPKRRRDR